MEVGEQQYTVPSEKSTVIELIESRSKTLGDGRTTYGLFSDSGRLILESPLPDFIKPLLDVPKIEYFPFALDDKELTDKDIEQAEQSFRNGIGALMLHIGSLERLFDKVKEDFSSKGEVGIRGATCSIDGKITSGDLRILDIRDVVVAGSEQGKEKPLVNVVDPNLDYMMYHRSWQWLIQSSQEIRKKLSDRPADAKKVFPILIVYNMDRYRVQQSARGAVEKVYVLDYPVK